MTDSISVRVAAVRDEAKGIRSYELRLPGGAPLPAFTAGSHVDLYLANGLVRSYSLCNDPAERERYVIGVQKDPASRGGSRYVFDNLAVGSTVKIGVPRNNFGLHEEAAHSVLIAGGIGVTPLRSMIHRLQALGRSWELYYCARTPEIAAFVAELQALNGGTGKQVHFNFDGVPGGQLLDLAGVVQASPAGSHFYCCGPLPMLAAFESATAGLPAGQVHVEYFTAKDEPSRDGGFEVELARSGMVLQIQPGETILDAVLLAGVDVSYACQEGVCGSCETAVVSGTPDHRDLVLSAEEHAANKKMIICCSGSKSARLVLDL